MILSFDFGIEGIMGAYPDDVHDQDPSYFSDVTPYQDHKKEVHPPYRWYNKPHASTKKIMYDEF